MTALEAKAPVRLMVPHAACAAFNTVAPPVVAIDVMPPTIVSIKSELLLIGTSHVSTSDPCVGTAKPLFGVTGSTMAASYQVRGGVADSPVESEPHP